MFLNTDLSFLKGKKLIITGASSGIGKTLTEFFFKAGASIGMISRTKENLEKIKEELSNDKSENVLIYATADVRNYSEIQNAMEELMEEFETIDGFIANAGVMRKKHFVKKRPDQIELEIDTNFKGVLYSIHAALPYLLKTKRSIILITSSIASVNPSEGMSVYGATKAAINSFVEATAKELKTKKVSINAILPGFIDTPMFRFGISEDTARLLNPLQPQNLVPIYGFFFSDRGRKQTGKLVNVEYLRQANDIILSMSKEERGESKWEDYEPILKQKLPPQIFLGLKQNKKLVSFLFSSSNNRK